MPMAVSVLIENGQVRTLTTFYYSKLSECTQPVAAILLKAREEGWGLLIRSLGSTQTVATEGIMAANAMMSTLTAPLPMPIFL